MEPNISALAHQVLDVCLRLRPGERVWVNSWDHTLELASGLAWEAEKRGCPVVVTVQPEDLWFRSLAEAPLDLVDGLPGHQAALLGETDVYIYTLGPRNPGLLNRIPEDRRNLVTLWFLEKNKFVDEWKIIARRRKVRMLGLEATLATPERAKILGLDSEEWSRVMFDGCMADYQQVTQSGRELTPILSGTGQVHISTPHGTDFTFSLARRPADFFGGLLTPEMVDKARVAFLPAGGIEVTGDEDTGEGTVVYDSPIRTREGIVEHLLLQVKQGRITHVSAKAGQQIFQSYLQGHQQAPWRFQEAKGDVDRFAFFGLGLNPKLRHGFTQDDKVLGGVTIAFGDNQEMSGKNRAVGHWWASMRDATVTIDDRTIMKDGKLLV